MTGWVLRRRVAQVRRWVAHHRPGRAGSAEWGQLSRVRPGQPLVHEWLAGLRCAASHPHLRTLLADRRAEAE
jgi:hypothetical protein